jgi:hypothetical protein
LVFERIAANSELHHHGITCPHEYCSMACRNSKASNVMKSACRRGESSLLGGASQGDGARESKPTVGLGAPVVSIQDGDRDSLIEAGPTSGSKAEQSKGRKGAGRAGGAVAI